MKRVQAMSKTVKKRHAEEFRQLCHEKRIPFTAQQRIVLQAVLDLGSHPTADEVIAIPLSGDDRLEYPPVLCPAACPKRPVAGWRIPREKTDSERRRECSYNIFS